MKVPSVRVIATGELYFKVAAPNGSRSVKA